MMMPFALALLLLPSDVLQPPPGAGPQRARASQYEIRLVYTGCIGPYAIGEDPCLGADRGTDIMEGIVRLSSSEIDLDGDVEYRGVLKRRTNVAVIDTKASDGSENETGEYVRCVTALAGTADVNVSIRIDRGQDGAFAKFTPIAGSARATVSGSCLARLQSEVRQLYLTSGDNAGFETVRPGRLQVGRFTEYPEGVTRSKAGEWVFYVVRAIDGVKAVAEPPAPVLRGAQAVLDGSRSEGNITSYKWTFVGDGCPVPVPPATRQGAVVRVTVLCPLMATLEVSDGSATDTENVRVGVKPRDWKTRLSPPVQRDLVGSRLLAPCLGCAFGRNVCAIEAGAGEEESGHFIHKVPNARTWEGEAYTLQQVQDPGGPFDGWWYLGENKLRMPRAELINRDLRRDSATYQTNAGANRAQGRAVFDIDTLVASVHAHEHAHTALLEEALRNGADPALTVEAMLANSRTEVRDTADLAIATAEETLRAATDEANVKARVRKDPRFNRGGKVLLRADDGSYVEFSIPNFAEMGESAAAAPLPPPHPIDSRPRAPATPAMGRAAAVCGGWPDRIPQESRRASRAGVTAAASIQSTDCPHRSGAASSPTAALHIIPKPPRPDTWNRPGTSGS